MILSLSYFAPLLLIGAQSETQWKFREAEKRSDPLCWHQHRQKMGSKKQPRTYRSVSTVKKVLKIWNLLWAHLAPWRSLWLATINTLKPVERYAKKKPLSHIVLPRSLSESCFLRISNPKNLFSCWNVVDKHFWLNNWCQAPSDVSVYRMASPTF